MSHRSLVGQLLVAHPQNPRDRAHRSVSIIVTHLPELAVALQLNAPHEDLTLSRVSKNIGIDHEGESPIYFGGVINQHKIHVIHSMDWAGVGTVQLTPDIGLTNDISVLMAISRAQGPEYYRACAGYWCWEQGQLEREIEGDLDPEIQAAHRWEVIPADFDLVFLTDAADQWHVGIDTVARIRVSEWF